MAEPKPWQENWVIEQELPRGGQGTTLLASHKNTADRGVLKVLRNQRSDQARRRMYREVANLKVLADAGCKVAAVLESNTDEFETRNVPLYFVMEYIPGDSLADVVHKSNGLGLEQAAAIALDICATLEKAVAEQVIHRDLKPENIIVRSIDPPDCVIVDYGLSFNQDDDEALTHAGETLDNRFLSLPERRVPGGDRRDIRSDLTGVCALLYYCITGELPVDLADANGRPPHRRPGRSVREKLPDDPRIPQLEVFFDRGFSTVIDARYQTVSELVERLGRVLHPRARQTDEDPLEFAQRSAALLLRHDRKSQIAKCKENSQVLTRILGGELSKYHGKKEIRPYRVEPFSPRSDGDWGYPEDVERLGVESALRVAIDHNPQTVVIAYEVYAKGTQCAIYRCMFRPRPGVKSPRGRGHVWDAVGNWEPILWYDGLENPDCSVVKDDLKACLVEAMQIIEREILQ